MVLTLFYFILCDHFVVYKDVCRSFSTSHFYRYVDGEQLTVFASAGKLF